MYVYTAGRHGVTLAGPGARNFTHNYSLPNRKPSILKKDVAACREEMENLLSTVDTSNASTPLHTMTGTSYRVPSTSLSRAHPDYVSLASSSIGPGEFTATSSPSLSPLTNVRSPPYAIRKKPTKRVDDRVKDIPLRAMRSKNFAGNELRDHEQHHDHHPYHYQQQHQPVVNGKDGRVHIKLLPRDHSSPSRLSVGATSTDFASDEVDGTPMRNDMRRSSFNPSSTCESHVDTEYDLISYLSRSDEDAVPIKFIDE